MNSIQTIYKSPYSKSMLLLLTSMDIIAAGLSLYIADLRIDSTLYTVLLLWIAIAYLFQGYNGRTYAHIQTITYHHILTVFGHATACILFGALINNPFITHTPHVMGIVLFWSIALSLKYGLFLAYLFLRNASLHNKQYLIIGHSNQANALRRFLKRQYGDLYRYAGSLAEPKSDVDLKEIASYCKNNSVHTIYYAGTDENPFAWKLYLLANQQYMYFHYLLNIDKKYSSIKWNLTSTYDPRPLLISDQVMQASALLKGEHTRDIFKSLKKVSDKKRQTFKYLF